ncbi:SspB family protein [Vannielia litorea]|uniref:Stringent starvation protein B n=1 Tax=Vannielia litorea TaxID=1217970 RepID=A0A1N6FC07_9RHOB|nr:ClpXP protease specificity-enhancing factor SspB [Vannielia litorea]SIN92808.1 hypothetical protein SAMN05444002_1552 [Vannielia litorea]
MTTEIDYGRLMHRAMRSLIRDVLAEVAERGLPGQHHFFITFDTHAEGVEIADWLRERYPEEMTVVMQHWFDDLDVTDDGFSVTLNFGDAPERLVIPYDAIATFVDPSVEFGLRFESQDGEEDDEDDDAPMAEDVEDPEAHHDAEVVSLDSFRK